MRNLSNKWTRAAIPALLLHGSIGTVYCWSYIESYIVKNFQSVGADCSNIGWAFSLAIFFLGMSAAFLGDFVEKDIHKASLLATICFVAGILGTALGVFLHSEILIILFYGVVMGFGLGLGYLSPVKTLMLWFADKKGLATGLAVAGFGAAKMIFMPIITGLADAVGIKLALLILAGIWFVMMFTGHLLLKKPDGWVERHDKFDIKEFFKRFKIFLDPHFIGIWLVFYINIACGLALISNEKYIYQSIGVTSVALLTALPIISGLFNAGGRLIYSAIGDKMKNRNTVYKIILISEIVLTAIALFTNAFNSTALWAVILVVALIFVVNAGYGGGFSNLPTLLSDVYGMGKISSIHGIALSAWAVAGLTGNQIAGLIYEQSHNYGDILVFTAVMYAIAIVVDFLFVKPHKEK